MLLPRAADRRFPTHQRVLVISPSPSFGSLRPASDAPAAGERSEAVAAVRQMRVEQILSGQNDVPQDYLQDDDEWVVVLAGIGVVEVDGRQHTLGPGDWAFLPAGVPHRVLRTEAGTSWLAVHLRPT